VIGQNLGSYRIISQLGAGAMGEVYLAEHRYLKRKAALKLLAPALVGRPDLLERFFLEARATSAIAHPGIVQIFDCEVDPTGRPYIVMEYLAGETLAARLARTRPLPPATVARLVRGMAEALEAAHAKGIVHRDLKPENIFVDETADTIKLVDFGIAKLAGEFRAEQVHQTRTGSMMGTPLYMSPEQCRDSAKLDFRTDLYSLGCVMFEMLTGRPPFTQTAMGELIVAHLTEIPKDVRALNPTVPAALAELCAALLQKDPAARPSPMREVVDRLNSFSATATTVRGPQSVTAPPPPAVATAGHNTTLSASAVGVVADSMPPAVAPPGRGRILVGAAALVLVGIGGTMAFNHRTATPPIEALRDRDPAPAPAKLFPPPRPVPVPEPPSSTDRLAGSGDQGATRAAASESKKTVSRSRATGGNTKLAERRNVLAPPLGARPAPVPAPHGADDEAAGERGVAAKPESDRPASVAGTWEGPWNDPGKNQKGRFFLQLADDGAVAGWMFNAARSESFRMVGRAGSGGRIELACQCPADRTFTARGELHVNGQGQLAGTLGLFTAVGAFGESHLSLRRKPTP